ncbi:MAG: response regulator [SAR324 cluster bacterium]|nr:response regulator [SAR324 cluster bacterium]
MEKILVIDDDDSIRKMLLRALSKEGYNVFLAENGKEGLERFEEIQPQVVLLDLRMPVMGGLECLRGMNIGIESPSAVIVLTGDGTDEDAEQCYQLGVKSFLRKPVNLFELKGLVKNNFELISYSSELRGLNSTLEQKVEKRTQELQESNLQLQISYSELERVSQTFQLFVPKQFINRIEGIKAGLVEEEELSILFTDIRSFTQMSEQMSSSETFNFLSNYLQQMEPCITQNGGFIDKFIGDGIMALFDRENSADKALQSAIDMQHSVDQFNQERVKNGLPPIRVGMGINTGPVRIGALGSERRLDSTVVGDHVNLTARLEGLTKKYRSRILISEYTYQGISKEKHFIREIDTVKVRGKSEPITVYEVFDASSPEIKEKKLKTRDLLAQGIQLYKNRNFIEAWETFRQCLILFPEDVIALEYVKRCRYFQKYPPIETTWSGVILETDNLVDHKIRRNYERYQLSAAATVFHHAEDRRLLGTLDDINIGGVKLGLGNPVNVGDIVTIGFELDQGSYSKKLEQIFQEIICQVVWLVPGSSEEPSSWQTGLKFLVMSLVQEKTLQEVLDRWRMKA